MLGGELGEDFSIKLDSGLFQLVDESGVGLLAVVAESRVQAHYPELSEVSLLIATVSEGVATRAHKRLVRGMQFLRANASVTLGSLQYILTAFIGVDSTFDSCHMNLVIRL